MKTENLGKTLVIGASTFPFVQNCPSVTDLPSPLFGGQRDVGRLAAFQIDRDR
jgi:hypothetical protein